MCFSVVTWMCFFNGQKWAGEIMDDTSPSRRWDGQVKSILAQEVEDDLTLLSRWPTLKTWLYLVGMAISWFASLRLPYVVAFVNVITHNHRSGKWPVCKRNHHLAGIYVHSHDCWSVWALSTCRLLPTTNHQVMFRKPPKQIDKKRMRVCLKKCLNWASPKFVHLL